MEATITYYKDLTGEYWIVTTPSGFTEFTSLEGAVRFCRHYGYRIVG
jgi:hypothetical protein